MDDCFEKLTKVPANYCFSKPINRRFLLTEVL